MHKSATCTTTGRRWALQWCVVRYKFSGVLPAAAEQATAIGWAVVCAVIAVAMIRLCCISQPQSADGELGV
jgi:hypothetical protein